MGERGAVRFERREAPGSGETVRDQVKVEWLGKLCASPRWRKWALAALRALDADDRDALVRALGALRARCPSFDHEVARDAAAALRRLEER